MQHPQKYGAGIWTRYLLCRSSWKFLFWLELSSFCCFNWKKKVQHPQAWFLSSLQVWQGPEVCRPRLPLLLQAHLHPEAARACPRPPCPGEAAAAAPPGPGAAPRGGAGAVPGGRSAGWRVGGRRALPGQRGSYLPGAARADAAEEPWDPRPLASRAGPALPFPSPGGGSHEGGSARSGASSPPGSGASLLLPLLPAWRAAAPSSPGTVAGQSGPFERHFSFSSSSNAMSPKPP